MAETILVVVEQQAGKLNRVSLETIAAAQSIAKDTGWQVEIAILGQDIGAVAQELAKRKAAKVYAIESPQLATYTSDAYVYALREFLKTHTPKLILMPHTYQVRDFVPSLALAMGKTVIPDAVGYKYENGKLLFTRQMFQGKFAADVSFAGDGPYLATFQNAAFRGDLAEAGTAPIETLQVTVPEGIIRVTAHEIFKEAKQAVDLSQAEVIVAVGRGIKEQKNMAMAEDLAKILGGDIAASRPICDAGWLPLDRQIGSSGQTIAPKLYIALGISGAIQHIVGMKGSRTIVAINKDAEAPIFEIADIGIVGNIFDVVPALTEEIKKAKAGA
ncbi:MAG TPA: electron transfer flavoprotein subunit alpha/FixB family protein [Acidobacteriaceae bacterium]|jgi:electron transfer flavoprotein alpha subunit|nr:electron transfer flavoprotein subunit alpha/FixB family protein [Acidobacteriaceae bacterium]